MKDLIQLWTEPLNYSDDASVRAIAQTLDLNVHGLTKTGEVTVGHRFLVDDGDESSVLALTRGDTGQVAVELHSTPKALARHGLWPHFRTEVEVAIARQPMPIEPRSLSITSPRVRPVPKTAAPAFAVPIAAQIVDGRQTYRTRDGESVVVLRDINQVFPRGQITAIIGSPGSGKSALLYVLAGQARLTEGRALVGNEDFTGLSEEQLRLRRRAIGVMPLALFPTLTVGENVGLSLPDVPKWQREERVAAVLSMVGLVGRSGVYPRQLSGRERRQAAIAQGLVNAHEVVIADEPTGGLDDESAADVMTTLRRLARVTGTTFIIATRNPLTASQADRVMLVVTGSIAETIETPTIPMVQDLLDR